MAGISRKSLFEQLENKQMLAGDVLVSVVHGNLVVRGDDAANQIAISSVEGEDGAFLIQGLEGTTVRLADSEDPAPSTGLVVEGVRGQVTVNLGAGDDVLEVNDAHFRRGLSVGMGAGNDTVRIGAGDDSAKGEEGDANVSVRGSLLVRTGSENDEVVIGSVKAGGAVTVATDGGDDSLHLGGAAVEGAETPAPTADEATLFARLGVAVLLGDGTDEVIARDVATRGGFAVGGGAGADQIDLGGVHSRLLGIRGGPGDGADEIDLSGVNARIAGIAGGAGANQVSIADSTFGSLGVQLGGGNDTLTLDTVTSTRTLLAGGEGDADELVRSGENSLGRLVVTGFEIPTDTNTPAPTPTRPGVRPPGNLIDRIVRVVRRFR